jgi:FAD/FMN-containing dehydrogenase
MSRTTRRVSLELRDGGGPPAGVAHDERGDRREFSGWLGLICALDALLGGGMTSRDTEDLEMSTTRPATTDAVAALRERLREIVAPGDPSWDAARQAWNTAADQRPVAVAYPRDAGEVAAIIRVARHHGLRVAPQGTGHNAPPLGDLADAVLLRTDRMRDVLIDPGARIARVGAGVLWEEVTAPAAEHGLVALHGSSPNVGVVGYSLGGGIGWLVRSHGIAANSVTAIELVTGRGEMVRADAEREPELFWALRGGGGDHGVVTAMEFRLYPLRTAYAGWLIWPWERSEEVLEAWADWTAGAPEEITSVGRIMQIPDVPFVPEPLRGRDIVALEFAYTGPDERGAELVRPFRDLGPEMDTVTTIPAPDLVRLHQDPEPPMPGMGGHVMIDRIDRQAVRTFAALTGPGSGSPIVSSEIRHLGGAAGRPAPGGGVLSHREGEGAVFVLGIPMGPDHAAMLAAEITRVEAAMGRFGHGRLYRNFTEARANPGSFHADDAIARLRAVRRRLDPDGVIRSNHPLDRGA